MRGPAPRAPRPPRADHDRPLPPPHRPRPGVTSPGQPGPAPRTDQTSFTQPPLDAASIDLYRDHRCLRAPLDGPPDTAKCLSGRAVSRPQHRHGDGADEEQQPTHTPDPTSASSTTEKHHVVGISNGG